MTTRDFSPEKALVRNLMDDLAGAQPHEMAGVLERYVSPDWLWRGMHPFHIQHGPKAVADCFWGPLATALRPLQRRPDIFMAGLNQIDDFQSVWVVQMGHFMGLFDAPYLGIRPTGKIAMMRYVEFDRVENGRITETCMHFDIPQLMIQAGQNPFPPETGAHLIQPGPMTHEGVMWGPQDPALGQETLAAINRMLESMRDRTSPYRERLMRDWHPDMIWWGPCGIGATYTIDRYILQHARPFGDALYAQRTFNGHICKMAEGHFGGFFGWPNLTLQNSGGFMGMTAGPGLADMRVIDLYREKDGKLAENWIFIDMLHYLNQQGLDVLARNQWLDYVNGTH
jgi:hypothetical protein